MGRPLRFSFAVGVMCAAVHASAGCSGDEDNLFTPGPDDDGGIMQTGPDGGTPSGTPDAATSGVRPCDNSLDCAAVPDGRTVCDPTTQTCVECVAEADCATGERCAGGVCRGACDSDLDCTPLGLLCDRAAGYCVECLAHADCDSAEHCSEGGCQADVCTPGETTCSGGGVAACGEAGDGFEPASPCGARAECVATGGSAECRDWVCTAGATECDAAATHVITCAADGLSVLESTDCEAAGLVCAQATCRSLRCAPSARFCEGNDVLLCSADGLDATVAEACGAGRYCDTATATCMTGTCAPGEPACNGSVAAVCNATGSGFEPGGTDCASTGEVCVAGACRPLICTPNALYCDSGAVRRCDTTGTASTVVELCSGGDVCVSNACVDPCADGLRNFAETDVDCGGGACNGCRAGLVCNLGSDCLSGMCVSGRCEAPPVGVFGYVPSNFDPTSPELDPGATDDATVLDCGISTFDSTTLAFNNWCGEPTPAPVATQLGGVDVVILPLRNLEVAAGSTLSFTGGRAVVLAVYGDATVAGSITLNAMAATPGAGGNRSCGTSQGGDGTGTASGGAGGGGGGGFGTAGGVGGDGGNTSANPGAAGAARGSLDLMPLYGGCAGGLGGGCTTTTGGGGGGALQLSVAGALSVSGAVSANGGNGLAGCTSEGGGAGGGSGGGLLFEGNTVSILPGAQVTANGGRGGMGAGGGAGGTGGTATAAPQPGVDHGSNGGGGGGGAVGRIRVNGAAGCTISSAPSPAPSLLCP